jgi:hypothetical protein
MVSWMSHGGGKPARARARVGGQGLRVRSVLALAAASLSLALLDCADNDKSLGEDCVKSEDCSSGFCSDQVCVAAPTTFDSEPPLVDSGTETGAPDARSRDAMKSDVARDVIEASPDVLDAAPDAPPDGMPSDTTTSKDGAKGGG